MFFRNFLSTLLRITKYILENQNKQCCRVKYQSPLILFECQNLVSTPLWIVYLTELIIIYCVQSKMFIDRSRLLAQNLHTIAKLASIMNDSFSTHAKLVD